MKVTSLLVIAGIGLTLILTRVAHGNPGEPTPTAVLWQNGNVATIEVTIPGSIAAGTGVSLQVYRKDASTSKRIIDKAAVPSCAAALVIDEVCKSSPQPDVIQLFYRFSWTVGSKATYQVAYFFTDDKTGDIGSVIDVSQMFAKEKPEVKPFDVAEKAKGVFRTTIRGTPNGEISISIHPAADPGTMPADTKKFIEERIRDLYTWLEPYSVTPKGIATVQVEPRTKRLPGNIPYVYEVAAVRLEPTGSKAAETRHTFNVVLVTNKNFPVGDYDLAVDFASGAPSELQGTLLNSQTGAAMAAANAKAAGTDTSFGLREFQNNLDLGLAFTSSVEDQKVGNATVRERKNRGVVDLRLAPWLNTPLNDKFTRFFTPIFIDAKVSTGKIDKSSLSLNRIIIGSKYSIRDIHLNPHANNILVYTFAGQSVSDRDFKRAEADFNFEFKPLIDSWNNELKNLFGEDAPESVLIKKSPPKIVPCCNFGYRVQPVIGTDIGYAYRIKRPAFNVENSERFVRRFYFGGDILLNLTKHVDLEVSDTLYVRGEAPSHRTRNYFSGEIRAPIFTSGTTSQCLFVKFEKGDQPPFSSPAVNSFKIGYRIASDFPQRR
jgi:hypothetical protein